MFKYEYIPVTEESKLYLASLNEYAHPIHFQEESKYIMVYYDFLDEIFAIMPAISIELHDLPKGTPFIELTIDEFRDRVRKYRDYRYKYNTIEYFPENLSKSDVKEMLVFFYNKYKKMK